MTKLRLKRTNLDSWYEITGHTWDPANGKIEIWKSCEDGLWHTSYPAGPFGRLSDAKAEIFAILEAEDLIDD